ncbi:claudin-4-like [Hypanus sabinus]|uniref:claudin-4-like n=1 Tax=Hypanus sabinus TaxID=79690 RepID=UPI0028C4D675|nr:claudin-4-like [Hypanus sabinus]
MVSMGLQILGIALCVIGWLGAIITCVLPMWRVTAFVGNNIVVAQIIWEGLWMNCIVQSTGQMQCKVYDSLLALSQDLQASRALTVIAIVVGVLGILISIVGGKCTNCIENEATKAKVTIISGIIFILAGVLTLIPVSWSANTIIKDFYNPLVTDAQRRELGASLYIGWGTSGLLILGGALLCCSCPPKDDTVPLYHSLLYNTGFRFCVDGSGGLSASRALTVISIVVGVLGILISIVGGKCTNCIENEATKAKVTIISGIIFILAGVLTLIPVSWSANTIIKDFYNPLVTDAQRRELGASLYIGWGTSGLLILGGALLCCSCPPKDDGYTAKYSAPRSVATSKNYV